MSSPQLARRCIPENNKGNDDDDNNDPKCVGNEEEADRVVYFWCRPLGELSGTFRWTATLSSLSTSKKGKHAANTTPLARCWALPLTQTQLFQTWARQQQLQQQRPRSRATATVSLRASLAAAAVVGRGSSGSSSDDSDGMIPLSFLQIDGSLAAWQAVREDNWQRQCQIMASMLLPSTTTTKTMRQHIAASSLRLCHARNLGTAKCCDFLRQLRRQQSQQQQQQQAQSCLNRLEIRFADDYATLLHAITTMNKEDQDYHPPLAIHELCLHYGRPLQSADVEALRQLVTGHYRRRPLQFKVQQAARNRHEHDQLCKSDPVCHNDDNACRSLRVLDLRDTSLQHLPPAVWRQFVEMVEESPSLQVVRLESFNPWQLQHKQQDEQELERNPRKVPFTNILSQQERSRKQAWQQTMQARQDQVDDWNSQVNQYLQWIGTLHQLGREWVHYVRVQALRQQRHSDRATSRKATTTATRWTSVMAQSSNSSSCLYHVADARVHRAAQQCRDLEHTIQAALVVLQQWYQSTHRPWLPPPAHQKQFRRLQKQQQQPSITTNNGMETTDMPSTSKNHDQQTNALNITPSPRRHEHGTTSLTAAHKSSSSSNDKQPTLAFLAPPLLSSQTSLPSDCSLEDAAMTTPRAKIATAVARILAMDDDEDDEEDESFDYGSDTVKEDDGDGVSRPTAPTIPSSASSVSIATPRHHHGTPQSLSESTFARVPAPRQSKSNTFHHQEHPQQWHLSCRQRQRKQQYSSSRSSITSHKTNSTTSATRSNRLKMIVSSSGSKSSRPIENGGKRPGFANRDQANTDSTLRNFDFPSETRQCHTILFDLNKNNNTTENSNNIKRMSTRQRVYQMKRNPLNTVEGESIHDNKRTIANNRTDRNNRKLHRHVPSTNY